MKSLFFFLLLAVPFTSAIAQGDLGSHFLRGTWQAQHSNPALAPKERFVFRIADVSDDIFITGVTYNDLIIEDEDGQSIIDIDEAIAQLEPRNYIREGLDIGTIGAGMRLGPAFLTLQHSLRYTAFVDYPKTLPQVIWQGNTQFIGEQVDVGPDALIQGYHELAFGIALDIGDRLTLGGRAKYLSGLADASTEKNRLLLYTDSVAYALELDADLLVNTSGALAYESFRDLEVTFDYGRFDMSRALRGNHGYAFDLGATLDLGKIQLAASVVDLGKIRWRNEVSNFSLTGINAFDGLDISDGLLSDSTEFGSVIDSLEEAFNVVETNTAYSTSLGAQYYLSGTYQLNDNWRFGALFYNQSFRGVDNYAAVVAANTRLLPFFELGATYGYRTKTWDNFGLNAVLRAGPVQLVASTDNILPVFYLKKTNSANLRVALNVVIE